MNTSQLGNDTPGKADDFLLSAECFCSQMALVFKDLHENHVDPDGTFQDIRLVEFDKWLPIVRKLVSSAQTIAEECFGADATPEIKNEILKFLLSFIGMKVDNPGTINFLSNITRQ